MSVVTYFSCLDAVELTIVANWSMSYAFPIEDGPNQPPPEGDLLSESALAVRLRLVRGNRSYRSIAERIGVNHETLRRNFQSGRVPATVIAQIAIHYSVDCHWLLTGKPSHRAPTAMEPSILEIHTGLSNGVVHDYHKVSRSGAVNIPS